MNIKDLIAFQEICKSKSITKAAAALYISPQGLSKSIRALEEELGVTLFIRTPKGVELTAYGICLQERSVSLIRDWQKITLDLERMSQMEKGFLHLCSAYGVLRILSPDFIFEFENRYPEYRIDYMEYPDQHVDEEILAGNFDVAFRVDGDIPEGFCHVPMFSSTVSLLVYEDHPLASRASVTIEDLKDEPMILESRVFQIHHMIRNRFADHGLRPNIIFNTSGFSLCHKLCQQKRGISVVVDKISRDMTGTGLVKIPFEEPMVWEVSLLYSENLVNSRLVWDFVQYTKEYIAREQI